MVGIALLLSEACVLLGALLGVYTDYVVTLDDRLRVSNIDCGAQRCYGRRKVCQDWRIRPTTFDNAQFRLLTLLHCRTQACRE